MPLAFLTFFSGLAISAVAIYYSVIGLAAIFAAAVVPIIVMGSILEISKLVAAWWLKANWHRAPFLLKSYMLVAVIVLMIITSMGIFGFLSKAHTEQSVPVGDNQARVQIIDERIAIEQEVIEQSRRDLTILNQQIERCSELGAVSRGVNVRNQQRIERDSLNKQITEAQNRISDLRQEKAPFAASLRAIEAEVGPIKYIAKLIYGDNPDQNILEKAVVWVIIVIVFVFDPLAVLLLLASQLSFQWAREEKQAKGEQPVIDDTTENSGDNDSETISIEPIVENVDETLPIEEKLQESPHQPGWAFTSPIADTVKAAEQIQEDLDEDDDEDVPNHIRLAKTTWKKDHPNDSLKHQRTMLEQGLIEELPWMLPPYNLEAIDDAVIEATRWAQEQIEESKKKDSDLDGETGHHTGDQEQRRIEGYQQNAEQNESTIWKRIQQAKQ